MHWVRYWSVEDVHYFSKLFEDLRENYNNALKS